MEVIIAILILSLLEALKWNLNGSKPYWSLNLLNRLPLVLLVVTLIGSLKSVLIAYDFSRQSRERSLFPSHDVHFSTILIKVEISMERVSPTLREIMKHFCSKYTFVFLTMIIRTVTLRALQTSLTLFKFEEIRMVLLLLPSMRLLTSILLRTSISVRANKMISLPVITHSCRISKYLWLASIILPVMRVNAHLSVMIIISVWTPDGFEVIKVEVHIYFVIFNQFDRKFFTGVSKAAIFRILTFLFVLHLIIVVMTLL